MSNTKTPTVRAARQGLGLGNHSPAISFPTSTSIVPDLQGALAVRSLARRFGLPPSTASAVATANGWGGPHG